MNVRVDEAGKRHLVARLNHLGALRNLDLSPFPDRLNSFSLDHDDGVFHRLAAAAVDLKTDFDHRRFFLR